MATVQQQRSTREIEYPTTDGKPMAETQLHMADMIDTIQVLQDRFADRPNVYVWGNLLLYYEEGNPRKHVSPDVLVARNVPKDPPRENYLVWKEGKAPDFVAEITSKSTRQEDKKKKFAIYRDILKVSEYFLFDPTEDYLDPPLQGFRLFRGNYVPIKAVAGRLPSRVLGLHLEHDGKTLRLFDPATGLRLPTRQEGTRPPSAGLKRSAVAPRSNVNAPRSNVTAPKRQKPLSSSSPRRTTASDARSRPSDGVDARAQKWRVPDRIGTVMVDRDANIVIDLVERYPVRAPKLMPGSLNFGPQGNKPPSAMRIGWNAFGDRLVGIDTAAGHVPPGWMDRSIAARLAPRSIGATPMSDPTMTSQSMSPPAPSEPRSSLDAIFAPRAVAVIGASEKAGSVGRSILWNLIGSPFGGTVYPVNPKRPNVLGIRSYPHIGAIPEPVDLAVVVTPAPASPR